jgi:hypothetical protein
VWEFDACRLVDDVEAALHAQCGLRLDEVEIELRTEELAEAVHRCFTELGHHIHIQR